MITIHNFNADVYDEFRKFFLTSGFIDTAIYESISAKTHVNEREAFTEYAISIFSDDIKLFINHLHEADEFITFINSIFDKILKRTVHDPVWKLLNYLENETDFFVCPASVKFHGNERYGLIRHSLLVLANGLKLAPIMLNAEVDMYYLIISCLFHDLCKTNMYEIKTRNVKNEETGNWEKAPYYKVKDSYISYGHGIESMLRLNNYITMPDSWNHAIRWHMGAYDLSPFDQIAMDKSMSSFREVLFLHTADMLAGHIDEI